MRTFMKTKLLLPLFVSAATAFAADPPSQNNHQYHAAGIQPVPLNARMQFVLTAKPASPVIALGNSGFVFSGPLVEGLRPLPNSQNLNAFQRFLRLPIIRLAVPGPMESPPGTGKYFAWRNTDNTDPWIVTATRPQITKGPE